VDDLQILLEILAISARAIGKSSEGVRENPHAVLRRVAPVVCRSLNP